MKNKLIKKLILPLSMAITFGAIAATTTFALFNGGDSVGVTASAGTTSIVTSISNLTFNDGHAGTATINNNSLTLTNFAEGDTLSFTINVNVSSPVRFKARFNIKNNQSDNYHLLGSFVHSLSSSFIESQTISGLSRYRTGWMNNDNIHHSISYSIAATSDIPSDNEITFTFSHERIQGNVQVADEVINDAVTIVHNKEELLVASSHDDMIIYTLFDSGLSADNYVLDYTSNNEILVYGDNVSIIAPTNNHLILKGIDEDSILLYGDNITLQNIDFVGDSTYFASLTFYGTEVNFINCIFNGGSLSDYLAYGEIGQLSFDNCSFSNYSKALFGDSDLEEINPASYLLEKENEEIISSITMNNCSINVSNYIFAFNTGSGLSTFNNCTITAGKIYSSQYLDIGIENMIFKGCSFASAVTFSTYHSMSFEDCSFTYSDSSIHFLSNENVGAYYFKNCSYGLNSIRPTLSSFAAFFERDLGYIYLFDVNSDSYICYRVNDAPSFEVDE